MVNRPKKVFDKRLGEKDKMKEANTEQIQHNWGNLRQLIDAEFTGERLEKLNEMYDYFEEENDVCTSQW